MFTSPPYAPSLSGARHAALGHNALLTDYDSDTSDCPGRGPVPAAVPAPLQSLTAPAPHFNPGDYVVRPAGDPTPPRAPTLPQTRPPDLAFQQLGELVDGVSSTPHRQVQIARTVAMRLERAGLRLPAANHGTAETIQALCGPAWAVLVESGRLNISSVLGAIERAGKFNPPLPTRDTVRLSAALGGALQRLGTLHGGVRSLLEQQSPSPRPLGPPVPDAALQQIPALVDFRSGVLNLAYLPGVEQASTGQLAHCMQECIRHHFLHHQHTARELLDQIVPAVATLVASGHIAPASAPRFLEAARRLNTVLHLWAGSDLPDVPPEEAAVMGMTPRAARRLHLYPLLCAALDPAALDEALRAGNPDALIPYPPRPRLDHKQIRPFTAMVRQALRPMVDTGLISMAQRNTLMQQFRQPWLDTNGAPS